MVSEREAAARTAHEHESGCLHMCGRREESAMPASRMSAWVFAAMMIVAGFFALGAHAVASPSSELGAVLSNIRFMGNIDFDRLVDWAKHDGSTPSDTTFQPQKTEAMIVDLSYGDRDAVMSWLRGDGRGKLHAAGASDGDIGSIRKSIEAAPSTPNPWRAIPLAAGSIDQGPQMGIQVLGGFAAVKKDGTGAIVCLSFKNIDPRVAKHVVIEFPIITAGGGDGGSLVLDRSGEFSPNVDIRAFESLANWQSGAGPRSQNDGCIGKSLPTAAIPFLQAQAAGYHVTAVDYAP
jgi:hypothetical protein